MSPKTLDIINLERSVDDNEPPVEVVEPRGNTSLFPTLMFLWFFSLTADFREVNCHFVCFNCIPAQWNVNLLY